MIVCTIDGGVPGFVWLDDGSVPERIVVVDFDVEDLTDSRLVKYQHSRGGEMACFIFEHTPETSGDMDPALLLQLCNEFDIPQEQEAI